MNQIERCARALCEARGRNPDKLEPGDLPCIDGTCPNGDPGHFVWRDYVADVLIVLTPLLDPDHDVTAAVVLPMHDRSEAVETFSKMIRVVIDQGSAMEALRERG